jgi:hypothetical protein
MVHTKVRRAPRVTAKCLFTAAILAILTGCATQVQVNARFPANDPRAAELRRVAVTDFYGPQGDRFAYALEAMLATAVFDGAPYFTLAASGERGRGAESRMAADYGRSVGASGVFFGQMQAADFHDEWYQGETTRCIRWESKDEDKDHKDNKDNKDKDNKHDKDRHDKDHGKCVKWESVPIPCVHRIFDMEVFPMMVKVSTGEVVYSARKRASTDMRWCKPDGPPMSDDALVAGAIDRIVADMRQDVAPYNAVLHAIVKEDSKGLPEAIAKTFDAAVKAAGKGDMSEACRLWGEVDRLNPNHPWTVYDLGVCAEANGNYASAVAQYERARTLSPKPDRDVAEAIARAQTLLAAHQELKREGHPSGVPQTVAPPAGSPAATPAPKPAPVAAVDPAHAKLVKTYGAKVAGWIEKHEVHVGMNAAAVFAARGNPASKEKVTDDVAVWTYGTQKIVFTKGAVSSVGK